MKIKEEYFDPTKFEDDIDDAYLDDPNHPVLVYANSSSDFENWDEADAQIKQDIEDFKSDSTPGEDLIIIKAEGNESHTIECGTCLINKDGKIIDLTDEVCDLDDYDEIEEIANQKLNESVQYKLVKESGIYHFVKGKQ